MYVVYKLMYIKYVYFKQTYKIKLIKLINLYEFIKDNQITAEDLWKDGIHLTETGQVFSARNL